MLPKLIEDRRLLLQNEKVLETLGEIDLLITEKSVSQPLKSMERQQAVKVLTEMSKNILLDIGIKQADPYEIVRFSDIMLKYFKELNFSEVKLAFELLLIGELDEFLPQDRNGQPDKNHYQSFSFEYISKVMKAYRKRKSKTWHKAHLALPTKTEPTEQDRKESRERFINDIKEAFNAYEAHNLKLKIYVPAYWVQFLHEKGFIKHAPDLSEATILEAYQQIMNRSAFLYERERVGVDLEYKKGRIHPALNRKANFQYYYDLVYKFFHYLLENNKNLNELI